MHLRRYIFLSLLLFGSVYGVAQTPFNGMIIEEVDIPPAIASDIQTEAGFSLLPRTWRMYVCLDQPDWELQAMFGGDFSSGYYPMELTPSGSSFYQSIFGNNQGIRAHSPGLEPAFPTLEFDSWFTIGNNFPLDVSVQGMETELEDDFEAANSGFLVNDPIGGLIYTTTITTGLPDSLGRILIGQFTSDGLFSGTLNFQFRQLEFLPADTVIYDPPGPAAYVTDSVGGITINNTPGIMDTVCSVQFLPIRLVDFNVSATEHQVNLNWETSSEENNDYFTIERSTDLTTWKEITRLDGAGTSSATRFYYAIDRSPELGINYYRLTQTDFNGDSETFGIRAVEFKGSSNITLYPNPAHTRVNLQGDLKAVRRYAIYDAYGHLVTEMNLQEGMGEINVSAFAPGMYHIDLFGSAGKIKTLRLNIQR